MPEQPQGAAGPIHHEDKLVKIYEEIKADIVRVGAIQPNNVKAVINELSGTAMTYTRDVIGFVVRIRNWCDESFGDIRLRLDSLEEAVEDLQVGESGGLEQEEVDLLLHVCADAKAQAEATLDMAKTGQAKLNDEVNANLSAVIARANKAVEVLSQYGPEEESEGE